MARLILVRHAPTPETGVRLTGRLPGVALGADGVTRAEQAADALARYDVAGVYTSPIERTAETAAIIARAHDLTPSVEEGVIEMDYGEWEGKTLKQLRRRALWRQVVTVPSQVTFPGGESFTGMQARAVTACRRIADNTGRGTAIIVSHADVIKAILSFHLGQPLDLFQRLVIAPTSASIIHLPASGPPIVETVNRELRP